MRMTAAEAAKAVGGVVNGDALFEGVCIDSRKVAPGCLFAAIEGERFDGHDFVLSAQQQGAAALLCHRPVEADIPVIMVKNTKEALLALARAWRARFDIPVVGLTGSVGKTTTKEMTACVLSRRYRTHKTQGNLNNEIGLPLTLFALDEDTQAAVIEMGMSDFGEISRLSRTACPTVGIITKIGVSHMETLGSQEGILKAKLELLDGLRPGAPLVLCGDDPFLVSAPIEGHPVYFFGIDNPACDFRAVDIQDGTSETRFSIRYQNAEYPVCLPTIGRHNVADAAAAFGAGVLAGVEPGAAAAALSDYQPAGMRQRVVPCGEITVVEDCYNASPDSVRASLSALAAMPCGGRRIAVLADMLELGSISIEAHFSCGVKAAECADSLFAFGPLAKEYVRGAKKAGMTACAWFEKREELVGALLETLRPGDVVLFKGSRGMKLEEAIAPLYERWKK